MPKKGYKQTIEHKKNNPASRGKHWILSKETKLKMSKVRLERKKKLGYINSEETRRRISQWNLNPSQERREILRIAHLGQTPWNKGKKLGPLSESHKNKLISSLIGRPCKGETRRKIGLANKGENNGMFGQPAWNRNIPHSKETLQKLKEKRKYRILPLKDTKIEIKIQEFLKNLHINFFTHQYINIEHGYQCDILIPALNLIIECDGNYWHKYPMGTDLDCIRTKELIEKGFKVLRLWETEIQSLNIDKFKEKINI